MSQKPADGFQIDPNILLDVPDLWAATIFDHEVPDFHSWLWRYLVSDIRNLVVLLPGGCGKTRVVSTEYPIYLLSKDRNCRIAIIQKGMEQAKDVMLDIQREFDGNENLKQSYGNFRPAKDAEGFPWSITRMRVAGNNSHEKTHNLVAFGAGSKDLLGNRFDVCIVDDVVTDENSGTPLLRSKLERWLATTVNKTLIADTDSPYQKLRMVGTAFYYDDLYLDKFYSRYKTSDTLDYDDWREPFEVDDSGYVVIRKSAEVGMKPGSLLWPKLLPQPELDYIKKTDGITDYRRRLCNDIADPDIQIFREIWFRGGYDDVTGVVYPGCLDHDRVIGERQPEWTVTCGVDPSSGSTTAISAEFAHFTIGRARGEDELYVIDMFSGKIPMTKGSDISGDYEDGRSQMGTCVARHQKYLAWETVLETNSQQKGWSDTVKALEGHIKVFDFTTDRGKKVNKDVGIASMAGMIENGKLRLPYGDATSRRLTNEFIEQITRYPLANLKDMVCALWFCYYRSKKKHKVSFTDFYALRERAKPLAFKN